jgi:hypothetical protein
VFACFRVSDAATDNLKLSAFAFDGFMMAKQDRANGLKPQPPLIVDAKLENLVRRHP